MILPRSIYDDSPPERRSRIANNPTLLYSWWCTIFSLVIIGFRLSGRYIRNERLFREDWIMAGSVIPLLARMAFIHVVLIWGTNNVNASTLVDPIKIHHREIGARLVLAARIFYTLFIWMAKFTVSEFLKRMTERFWKKGYEWGLRGIRIFLLVTFIAVVISTLAECHPFSHYWQVIPDPGPQCRQGYGHLLAMGVTDIITDILLVAFPIPIILRSSMSVKRKFSLIALFSMSVILIIITGARIPLVIQRHGLQQFRTVLASSEILAAAIISNAIVLGSFLRDRGIKKAKYKGGSVTDSMERRSSHTRRHTLQQWGSDEDLARSLGYRTKPEYADPQEKSTRPAPVADLNLLSPNRPISPFSRNSWQFPTNNDPARYSQESSLKVQDFSDPMPSPRTGSRRVSFFDVGGLLEGGVNSTPSPTDSVITHDFAPQNRRGSRASNAYTPGGRAYPPPARRSSRLSQQSQDHEMSPWPSHQLQDPGGLLAESRETPAEQQQDQVPPPTTASSIERSPTETSYDVPSLQDAGGLLSPSSKTS